MPTVSEIEGGLREAGLGAGDTVILHSSLSSLGWVEGGAGAVIQAFLNVLGPEGTLVAPTFGALGVIPDTLKQHPGAVHSIHPMASVVAVGARADSLCAEHWKPDQAHGPGTPYMRLVEAGGTVCLLGVDQDRNTLLHTAEELLRLPYLSRTPETTFQTPEGPVTRSWPDFPGPHRNFIGLDRLFRDSGRMRMARIGQAVVRVIRARDLLDLALEAGRKDPAFVLCDNPACADCVAQRAALRRARLAAEPFRLAASSFLAGRYLPEMIERCRAAGIGALELDGLEGVPVERLAAARVADAVRTLRESSLEVCALRGRRVGPAPSGLIETARAAGIPRVVLPLSDAAERELVAARLAGVALSFFNTTDDSDAASARLVRLRDRGLKPALTFHAAAFARLGETPFLASYKKPLRRFVDQLDLEDGLYDGRPASLGRGQAEIKEMMSILRCAGFRGWMVLGAANRETGTLQDAADRALGLLDSM